MSASESEARLLRRLKKAPRKHDYRYTEEARVALLKNLFGALTCHQEEYLDYLFPNSLLRGDKAENWNLSFAQGAVEGAEYSTAARGKPCGHIFKSGEATYRCKTCSLDDTCVLCSKCFAASDHTGHAVSVYLSHGNSGCCDCGDVEAWQIPVKCAIHTAVEPGTLPMEIERDSNKLPVEFIRSIRSTIARAMDYICDVISCSPEQLRLPKSEASIRRDEEQSRLVSAYYEAEGSIDNMEYALVLWNDEKHTVHEVQEQVARACKESKAFGKDRAEETDFVGRSIVKYSTDIVDLMSVSRIIEQIKVTVTIRSSRDIFRERMCGTIIEWLEDISGCSVGDDHDILRKTICEEFLAVWRVGSKASNAEIGKEGIDDHALQEEQISTHFPGRTVLPVEVVDPGDLVPEDMDVDAENEAREAQAANDDEDDDHEEDGDDIDMVGGPVVLRGPVDAGYTAQQIIRAAEQNRPPSRSATPGAQPEDGHENNDSGLGIPSTPHVPPGTRHNTPAPPHWVEKPTGFFTHGPLPPYEDIRQRVRLDWLIMFNLRLWKKARNDLRDLFISTVVTIPAFKRIFSLRFAALYTTLSELHLIADREPDHSIIHLSLQMLTTPSITAEVVRRGNFLTTLMAILYSFLTTRQVSRPSRINKKAILAFDGSSTTNPLTNRRLSHFFLDLRYLLGSDYVQEQIREEPRYTLQFLDLVRLHQGVCPNVRAVSQHVEFEADAWVSAAFITREINKLARQFAEAFHIHDAERLASLRRSIVYAAKYATISSMGWEPYRYQQVEMKRETLFHVVGGYQLEADAYGSSRDYTLVNFSVDKEPISFHHPLHYTLSWLVEAGKGMEPETLRKLLSLDWSQLEEDIPNSTTPKNPEDLVVAMFDIPLRVCVWLAQMRTMMWVRNGYSLRHQMQSYRGVAYRDLTHHRDIFLLQAGFAVINPSRMLANMIDRFQLEDWVKTRFSVPNGYDDMQFLDLAEDFLHLLIIILSDRIPLIPTRDEPQLQVLRIKRELIHTLCFKPLQYSEITRLMPERLQDHAEFQSVLSLLTNYRPPDGLSDYGTFELKDQFLEEVDPYIVHFTKNQREEMESNYRSRLAKRTGKSETEIAYEPRLRSIKSGVFVNLAAFTRTALFAQVIYSSLLYVLKFQEYTPKIPETRVETFLQLCLHLCQLAVAEDCALDSHDSESFVLHSLTRKMATEEYPGSFSGEPLVLTIAVILCRLATLEEFKSCWAKINHLLRAMKQKRPVAFATTGSISQSVKLDSDEPSARDLEVERKKQLAKERQAKIMAQIKQQQQSFLESADFDFADEDESGDDNDQQMLPEQRRLWKFPTGTCILCQEEMNDLRIYGTLAFVTESNILRITSPADPGYVRETVETPENLDRSAQEIRPFGVAAMNYETVRKLTADGLRVTVNRKGLGDGFPSECTRKGPIATGCSHLMHFSCFDHYCESARRRHPNQIARNHPENLEKKEFVCPLCKALGNAFLPIIWRVKEESPTGVLSTQVPFETWLHDLGVVFRKIPDGPSGFNTLKEHFHRYAEVNFVPPLFEKPQQLPNPPLAASGLSEVTRATSTSSQNAQVDELLKAFQRLRDTYRDNDIPSTYPQTTLSWIPAARELTLCDSLAHTLGFSISSVEISQRGIGSESGSTLLDTISPQTLTHLRILSEAIYSYYVVGALCGNGEASETLYQFRDMVRDQMRRLFVGDQAIFDDDKKYNMLSDVRPLLESDIFVFLADCSLCLVPYIRCDMHHIMRLCYIAEITKAVLVFVKECDLHGILSKWEAAEQLKLVEGHIWYTEHQLELIQAFASFIGRYLENPNGYQSFSAFALAVFRHIVGSYATPFLRKCMVLLQTRFGVLFQTAGYSFPGESEQDRLSRCLRLPSVDSIFELVLSSTREGQHLRDLIAGWCKHVPFGKSKVEMAHPAIFELVGLPDNFEVLIEEAMKRRCLTTGKDVIEPTLCLFCGKIFCGQAACCTRVEPSGRRVGGSSQHMRGCGGNVGIFLNIRKCCLIYLHNHNGSFTEAPYMDAHGETDFGLRRSRQLFLNQRRYDALVRNVWLQHGIPSVISRKLEADMNTGGWDTL